jgi:hypothetical protein
MLLSEKYEQYLIEEQINRNVIYMISLFIFFI